MRAVCSRLFGFFPIRFEIYREAREGREDKKEKFFCFFPLCGLRDLGGKNSAVKKGK